MPVNQDFPHNNNSMRLRRRFALLEQYAPKALSGTLILRNQSVSQFHNNQSPFYHLHHPGSSLVFHLCPVPLHFHLPKLLLRLTLHATEHPVQLLVMVLGRRIKALHRKFIVRAMLPRPFHQRWALGL
jgi:hypothetical protein